jgi:pilus assembly protein CpaF
MNFIHESIARNGIAVVFRKTPAKIRLKKEKLMEDNYVSLSVHDFLIKAVQGHCNIIMCGETGSGKTEFLKYLASHTFENEKVVTIEDTLELHLDRIYPHRDIVAMKTNNIASYSDVLVTCMRQNPIWILLSEVRSAEAVTAVRNSISSGHFILSTIHADKASNIPYRLYSLLESNIDVEQFLNTIYRYIQLGVFLRGRFDPKQGKYVREIGEVCEFYVDDDNNCVSNVIYQKTISGEVTYKPISEHLLQYIEGQGIDISDIRKSNGNLEKLQTYDDELSAEAIEQKEEPKEEVKVEPVQVQPTPVVNPTPVVAPTPVQTAPPVQPVQPSVPTTPVQPVQPSVSTTPVQSVQTPVTQTVTQVVTPVTQQVPQQQVPQQPTGPKFTIPIPNTNPNVG